MEVMPGYKQTKAGIIPEEWNPRGLLSVLSIANGQVDPRIEPFRSMILVAPDHIESSTGKLLAKRTAAEQRAISGKYLFSSGDIVYSKIRPYLKKAILADFSGLCSADMYPLRPVDGVIGGYILPVLLAHRFTKYAESVSVRSGMPKINRAELADFSIAIPPLREQQKVATALRDVDSLLDSLDLLIAKKRNLKQAAMQQLLTGQTRLPGFSDEWEVKRLGDLGATYGGLTGKTKADFGNGDAKYITFMNVMQNVVIDSESFDRVEVSQLETQNRARKGDLFFNGSSETPEEVALCAVLLDEVQDVYLNSFCFGFRFREEIASNGIFFAYYLRGPVGRELMKSLAQGSTRYNLSKVALLNSSLLLPTPLEQTAIAEVLTGIDTELVALEQRRKKTSALKQGMMQELLTGRTRLV